MKNRYPTAAELYALELKARRMRAEEMGRLLRVGAAKVRALFARIVAVRNAKGWRHA